MLNLLKAINFAAQKHSSQLRKDNKLTPYINHPIEVATILAECEILDVNILIAGILHDVLEDTDTNKDELLLEFGSHITNIVLECTDDKVLNKVEKKQHQLYNIEFLSTEAKLVKMADKYSNLKGLLVDPPKTWSTKEIYGYGIWVYTMLLKVKGLNANLELKFRELFNRDPFFSSLDPKTITDLLSDYYNNIDKSD